MQLESLHVGSKDSFSLKVCLTFFLIFFPDSGFPFNILETFSPENFTDFKLFAEIVI